MYKVEDKSNLMKLVIFLLKPNIIIVAMCFNLKRMNVKLFQIFKVVN